MQLDLISRTASCITPTNVARAQNIACQNVPEEVTKLEQAMNDELRVLQTDHSLTLEDTIAQIDNVLAQFPDLASSLNDQRTEAVGSGPESPSPTATSVPAAGTPTATPTVDPATADTDPNSHERARH
jgi:hypothetical protein